MILEGLMLLSAGLSLWGKISGASAEAEAAEKNAQLKREQADELMARQFINEQVLRDKAMEAGLRYGSSFAASGREGAGLGGMLRIKNDVEENIKLSRREADFKASMLRKGADIDSKLSSDAMTAGYLSGAGTLLSMGTDAYRRYDLYKGINQTKGLPALGGTP